MKRKLIKSLSALALVSACIFATPIYASAADNAVITQNGSNIKISNSVLSLTVNDSGKFDIETIGGDPQNPNDDNVEILYGYTNGEAIKVGDDFEYISCKFNDALWNNYVDGNSIVSEYTFNGVNVKRILTLEAGPNSTYNDSVKFKYILTNTTDTAQDTSFQLMLDTLVAGNDDSPFNIPDIGSFDTGKRLTGDEVPNYWFTYDNLENPKAICKGSFLLNNKPNVVDFSNWSSYSKNRWEQEISEGEFNGDSCVNMYWNNNIIQPGESKVIETYYSIGASNVEVNNDLAISILNGDRVNIIPNEDSSYSPYGTSAVIKNIGDVSLKNVQANIIIPEEYKDIIALTSPSTFSIESLDVNSEKLISYTFEILKDIYEPIEITYTINVTSDTTDVRTISQTMVIQPNAIRSISAELEGENPDAVKPNEDNKYDNYNTTVNVTNNSESELDNVTATIVIPDEFKDILSLADGEESIFTFDKFNPNDTLNHSWNLVVAPGYEDKVVTYYVYVQYGDEEPIVLTKTLNISALIKPVEPVEPVEPEEPAPEEEQTETPSNESKPTSTPSTTTTTTTTTTSSNPKTGDAGAFGTAILALLSLGTSVVSRKKYTPKH